MISAPSQLGRQLLRNSPQESLMRAHGNFYSVAVVIKPKNIVIVNTRQTRYLRNVP
jgi:hypothetical protein